jgi:ribosomal protein L31E
MKGNEAEYIIPLAKVFNEPKNKRFRKAVKEIKDFVTKHTRIENIALSNDLNAFITKDSYNLPRKINAILVKKDNRVKVYLKGSKELEEDKKKAKAAEEEKRKKKEEKEKKEQEKTADEKAEEEEKEKKKEEKKQREKSLEKADIKRKTGRK